MERGTGWVVILSPTLRSIFTFFHNYEASNMAFPMNMGDLYYSSLAKDAALLRSIGNGRNKTNTVRAQHKRRAPTTMGRSRKTYGGNTRYGGLMLSRDAMKYTDDSISHKVFFSNFIGAQLDPTSGTLGAVTQGVGSTQRLGRSIRMRSINIKGTVDIPISPTTSTAQQMPSIVLYLVLDTQTNKAQLDSQDVIGGAITSGSLATAGYRNIEHIERFKILKTWRYQFPQPAIGPNADTTTWDTYGIKKSFHMFKSFNIGQRYVSAGGATIGAIVDNSLHLIGMCNDTGTVPGIEFNVRMGFTG